jgi:hypothetical protein
MSLNLSETENFSLGMIAAIIEGIVLQPTVYWKNARIQQIPITLNPSVWYRGITASIINEIQMLGLHFGITGLFRKTFLQLGYSNDRSLEQLISACLGGAVSALFVAPVELIMIQQQINGGSIYYTLQRIHGVRSLTRGLGPAMIRDSIFVSGFLGITPLLQRLIMENYNLSSIQAGFWASVIGGSLAAVPSHPLDLVKTCMQGDLEQIRYKGAVETWYTLWGEGNLSRIYRGCFWSSFNIMSTVYIANECRLRLPPILFHQSF